MFVNEKTQIMLKGGTIIETTDPIIYSGNYLLVSQKSTQRMGDSVILTSEITPYHFDTVKKITTNQVTKQYTRYENNRQEV